MDGNCLGFTAVHYVISSKINLDTENVFSFVVSKWYTLNFGMLSAFKICEAVVESCLRRYAVF